MNIDRGQRVADASDPAASTAAHGEPLEREGRTCTVSQEMFETLKIARHVYKGDDSPTMCPDCGRRVVGRNPAPPDEIMLEALKAEAERRGIKP